MTNQPATTSIARKARKALSAALYNAARIAAADIAKLDATYGEFAQRKVDAVNADSPVEMLIKVAVDLVLIADRMDREIEAPKTEDEPQPEISPEVAAYHKRLEFERTHVQRQAIGWVPAKLGNEIEPGDVMIWNYGYRSDVISMKVSKSGKTASLTLRECESGRINTRRIAMATKYAVAAS